MNTRIGWHIVQSVIQRDMVTSLDLIHFTIEIIIQVGPYQNLEEIGLDKLDLKLRL